MSQIEPDPAALMAEMFAEQVESRPDAVALRHREGRLTYAELASWRGALAADLEVAGVGPGSLVAVAADRGPAVVAAVLALAELGAGYLPIDPEIPLRRQRQMVKDAGPACLLAERPLDRFATWEAPRVWLDRREGPRGPALRRPPAGGEPCFQVVYTSGSTGQPKGVRIGYHSVLNRLSWMWRDYPFDEESVMTAHKSFALVASPWELLGGLLRGVPTVLLARDEVLDANLFLDALCRERMTHAFLTPSLISALLDEIERRGGADVALRLVTSGADHLGPEAVYRFRRWLPGVTLLNLYGMTETASNVACYDTARLPEGASRVPVGRPVAGAVIELLDASLRPVPLGARGEIHISGRPVALGYHNPHPSEAAAFGRREDGTPRFRTGDVGRWLPTGDLEILGRADNQVKIRGYRVELEEVDAIVSAAPHVASAGVCVDEDGGEPVLKAGLTADGDLELAALRAFVRERLPEYMVPRYFAILSALPLTSTGKLDRAALARALARSQAAAPQAAGFEPSRPEQAVVVELWTRLLGRPPASVDDHFFDAGGHSLLAMRLAGHLSAAFGRRIPLRSILDAPTVAGLASLGTA